MVQRVPRNPNLMTTQESPKAPLGSGFLPWGPSYPPILSIDGTSSSVERLRDSEQMGETLSIQSHLLKLGVDFVRTIMPKRVPGGSFARAVQ